MDQEDRRRNRPVPNEAMETLSELQVLALRRIEGFGWKLQFIRRPLFQDPVPVVANGDGMKIGILEEDGRINMEPDIKLRE